MTAQLISLGALCLVMVVMFVDYLMYRDEMFFNYGVAFLFFSLARGLNIVAHAPSQIEYGWIERFTPLAFSGVAALFLVIGALNGKREYKETPYLMLIAVLVSAGFGAQYPEGSLSSFVPTVFAITVGNISAAVILGRKYSEDKACLFLYRALSVLFWGRAAASIASVWEIQLNKLVHADFSLAVSISISLSIAIVGVLLARSRSRVRSCQGQF